MYYPIWDIPGLGGAMVIAGISIVHVIIAHFAVGAGIFNALTEWRARRTGDPLLLGFVRDNSKFLVYLAFVAGAVTGVGIWFSIGLVAPEATTYLIRTFFWIWAIEWVFFLVELVSGYLYYYTWDRVSPRLHLVFGWAYAVSAFASLVMINGILTFMMTPGEWLQSGSVWDAWLNESFWPSLWLRTVSALSLAGVFVALVVTKSRRYDRAEKAKIIRWGARFLLLLALMPPLAGWYFWSVPESSRSLALGGAVAMTFIFAFGLVLSFLVAVYALFGMLRKARDINFETALLMAAIAFLATATMEFVREGIRKPFVIRDIVYSNGILADDVETMMREGVLRQARWIEPDTSLRDPRVRQGEQVYRVQCLRCHQIDGYNAIRPLIAGWNYDLIETAVDHLDKIKGFMPPFIGTETEKAALIDYLLHLSGAPADSTQGPPMPVDTSATGATPLDEGVQS